MRTKMLLWLDSANTAHIVLSSDAFIIKRTLGILITYNM